METVYADLDELLFEKREKNYGAYEHRRKSERFLSRGALIAFLLFFFLTALPKMIEWAFPKVEEEAVMTEAVIPVNLSDLPPPPAVNEEEPPPPPPDVKLPPPQRATIEFKIPEPVPDDQVQDDVTIEEIEDVNEKPPGFETREGTDDGVYDFTGVEEGTGPTEIEYKEPPKSDDPDPNAFINVEKEPAPVNLDEIKKLIGYPPMAREAGIEGKVYVRVLVDDRGNYVKHIVLKDPHPVLTNAVANQLRNIKFTPGIQAGKPIKVWVNIPFDFKLSR